MRRKDVRKMEIKQVREEGRSAALAGKSIHSCPRDYLHNCNRPHWEEAFKDQMESMRQEKKQDCFNKLAQASTVEDLKEWLIEKFFSE